MNISGHSYIAGQWQGTDKVFQAWYPGSDTLSGYQVSNANEEQLNLAVQEAQKAFVLYRRKSAAERAAFLTAIADEILALGDELLSVTHNETGLPLARLQGERGRTMNQLKAFAANLLNPIDSVINESADPDRAPLPKPATSLDALPLGPVAVFGASNFPYAFSTLGGDTASALAVGCPVIVKGHPAHPGTSELMARAIDKAIVACDMPAGVFSLLQTEEVGLSHALVAHSGIKAVGFTGSYQVAMHLQKTIHGRRENIPFYGELGSVNPQLVLPGKAEQDSGVLAEQLCQSLLMGNGQFCTSPGIWLIPESQSDFIQAATDFIGQQDSQTLLTRGIVSAYNKAIEQFKHHDGVTHLAQGKRQQAHHGEGNLFLTRAQNFIQSPELQQEVFGPSALIVTYQNPEELDTLIDQLEGQLTASVHGTAEDIQQYDTLLENLSYKVGRLIYNQMPTGVEVCDSMNHGGPFPASTDVRSTSVGTMAYKRFVRPICYQNRG